MMLESLEQFPKDEQERRLKAIGKIVSRMGRPERPTSVELRAIRRGEEAYRRGDFVTLDEYLRTAGNPSPPFSKKRS
jgi:hypothetical protein